MFKFTLINSVFVIQQ